MKISVIGGIFLCLSVNFLGCNGIKLPPDNETFYRVTSPDQRVNNQVKYFKNEYLQIAKKRNQKLMYSGGDTKPVNLIGLGLSGGGIRSAAYQLGLLAGLQSTPIPGSVGKKLSALDRVDYLSCVSGGCWAAGAFLIAKETPDTFFNCLNEQAFEGKVTNTEQCGRAKDILRDNQPIELAQTEQKEKWEENIRSAYFPEDCREFEFSDRNNKCWENLEGKPNIIFNTTHSTVSPTRFGGNIDNLPFQITPDQLGTIVDCGSEDLGNQKCGFFKRHGAGSDKIGFFVRQDAKDFKWSRRETSFKSLWLIPEFSPGTHMSKAMASASAVIGTAKELSFSMGLTYKRKEPGDEIRNNYFLTDGGFTENLGLLSLVERGVDLIVLSDMSYPERPGDDLKIATDQVKKLLKCVVTGTEQIDPKNLVTTIQYTCPNVPQGLGTRQGKILYVRPYPDNIKDFKVQLQSTQEELYSCIEKKTYECYGKSPLAFKNPKKLSDNLEQKYQFPQTDTMLSSYDNRLIRSYYLLGKFIGEHYVGPVLNK
jgi:hypothetical protein